MLFGTESSIDYTNIEELKAVCKKDKTSDDDKEKIYSET
jgi:hypothetical protein